MRKNVFSSSIKILIVSLLLLAVFFQKERSQKLMALALILWIAVTAGIEMQSLFCLLKTGWQNSKSPCRKNSRASA